MYHSPLVNLKGRFVFAVLLSGAMLTAGLFGINGQSPSWAAPSQNPHLQTVPPRPPDDPPPPPPPPDSAPPAEAPASPSDESNGDNTPAQSPEQTDNASQDEPQPAQPSEQTDNGGQGEAQPSPAAKSESDENKNQAPPAQPQDPGLDQRVRPGRGEAPEILHRRFGLAHASQRVAEPK
ncbi:MAG: hypothetical protein HYR94_23615, partial [Chloroflexi bacterium]|nr:hypothetical protein [Chloroflexota bacterium]